jgi:hypothetical protein
MDAKALRGWLLCQPRPYVVRTCDEHKAQNQIEVKPGVSWAHIAKSVAALRPVLVEALDASGNTIRAIRPEDETDEDDDELDEPEDETMLLSGDGESRRLITFAKLLADAYKHSNDVAFARLADLFDAVTRRSEAQEKALVALQRMLLSKVTDGDEDSPASFEQTMLAAFMQGQAQQKAAKAAAAATKTNGTHVPTED